MTSFSVTRLKEFRKKTLIPSKVQLEAQHAGSTPHGIQSINSSVCFHSSVENLTLCITSGTWDRAVTGKQVDYDPQKILYLCSRRAVSKFFVGIDSDLLPGEVVAQNQIIFIPSAPIGKAHVSCQLWFSIQPLRSCTSSQIIAMFCSFQCSCEIWWFWVIIDVLKKS